MDIQSIIAQMTLEEKAALCSGASAWTTTPIERLNVPEMLVSDGPHGVRRVPDVHEMAAQSLPATCFPTASCLASTWNVDLISRMGTALAEECIALDVDVVLGPGANMKRSPLGGRNFEYFSEDPYLAGEMAANFINGVQSKGVGTSLKHYVVNNQEFQRCTAVKRTKRLCQNISPARRDQNYRYRPRFSRLCLLSPEIPKVGDRRRGIRYFDWRLSSRYSAHSDGNPGIDSELTLYPQ